MCVGGGGGRGGGRGRTISWVIMATQFSLDEDSGGDVRGGMGGRVAEQSVG